MQLQPISWAMPLLFLGIPSVSAWVLRQPVTTSSRGATRHATTSFPRHWLSSTPIIDADFERVERGGDQNVTVPDLEDLSSKSLLELSLASDPDWNETRIPFMDGDNFIDVKLAFMAELDGVQYGIGVPFDHAAAVTIEQKDGTVVNLSPDDPESEEMIQVMADQLQKHVSEDLSLKKTPRILTIKGPLEAHTKDWKEKLIPQSIDTKTLLDDSDEDLAFFHDFMRKELGEEEYTKTLQEDMPDIDSELMELFGAIGEDGSPTVGDLFPNGIDTDKEDLLIKEMEDFINKDISRDGVALKLISYSLQDGNKYSVVQLLKPYALVGRYTENDEDLRFDLLSPKEADLVLPRLEDACREDLQNAGLTADNIAN
eukprot:scaffold296_cov102-Amphora_coffeaeformis.AAC.25